MSKISLTNIIIGAIIIGILINNTLFYYRLWGVINNYISQTEVQIMFFLNLVLSIIGIYILLVLIF